jgi:hypothetical protein
LRAVEGVAQKALMGAVEVVVVPVVYLWEQFL